MTDREAVDDSIGPTTDLEAVRFPDDLAERFGVLYGTDPLRDGREWVAAIRAAQRDLAGRAPTAEDLCTTDDGAHAFVTDDGSQDYVCVLDPLVVPFLRDEAGTVRSTTPVRGETVETRVDGDGVSVSHPDAVVSLGLSDHVDADTEPTLATVYRQVCGYVHVFADEAEYETWAAEAEATTTAVPIERGVGIAEELAGELFGEAA
ncbi:organomercurial lyase [Haloarcula litorea]|uniref:organomercurial lyase n=1 Tax=Haloarcula litorea TaxID=3032579 RepID=UPI0023E789E8|nr:organomercurial lyase [Halomicroarcula sp. GDY20]